jgi:hypothetical protein
MHCSSNLNSSDDVLEQTANPAHRQPGDWELVGGPLRKGDAYISTSIRPCAACDAVPSVSSAPVASQWSWRPPCTYRWQ